MSDASARDEFHDFMSREAINKNEKNEILVWDMF